MALTKSDRLKLIQEMKEVFATKDDLTKFATKDDLTKFATKDDLTKFATKDDLTQLRQDMLGDKAEILGAINKKSEDDDAHKMLHHNLGEDVPDLQRQVKHLYTTFEIDMPVSPAY